MGRPPNDPREFEFIRKNGKNIFFVASCQNEKPVNADKYGIHGIFVFYFYNMKCAQITEKNGTNRKNAGQNYRFTALIFSLLRGQTNKKPCR